jgi:large subunit ribosomal protein L29
MDIKELRNKSKTELNGSLTELRKELFSLRMKKSTGQLRTTHELKLVKRNIARLHTILAEKGVQDSKEGGTV